MPKTLKQKPQLTPSLEFGAYSTDLMFEVDWNVNRGWYTPKITPYRKIKISPFCGALNYSVSVIENEIDFYLFG